MYEDGSSGFADPKIKPLLLPSVQLAGAALRCWAGPTAAGLEYKPPISSALHAALEAASPVQTGHIEAAAELGILLASVVPGPNCEPQQLLSVMQQPTTVRALEACIRCWVQLYSDPSGVWTPAYLADPHKDLVHSQRMTFALTAPLQAALSHPAAAGVGQCAGSECFAFCATSLKAGVVAAGQALRELRTAASNAPHSSRSSSSNSSSSSSSSMDCRRIVYALLQAAMTADVAMAACSSLAGSSGSSSSSSSDVSQLRPAWLLLSAHSLYTFGSILLAAHADGLLPVAVQQELPAELLPVVQSLATAVAWTGTVLSTMQQQAAAAAAALPLGSEQGNDRVLSLLQQQEC
ncbi:hypothetical protein OEZ86_010995 [Tetradesmus obliquus]|nr:hypothetical protein OEZ86_010995 [Tetradesmus obliquus]